MIDFIQVALLCLGLASIYGLVVFGGNKAVERYPNTALISASMVFPLFLIWCILELGISHAKIKD